MERSGREDMAFMPRMTSTKTEEIKKHLFKSAMKGDWTEVVKIYRQYPVVREAKITRSQDTALHIAVSDGQEDIVVELVLISVAGESKEALKIKNELGNTPLHVAAALGSVKMCECIAKTDPELIGARNHESETPFFLAALNGKKYAFLSLYSICGEKGYSYCRRSDGETILHSAISGDYFDLAFQIIRRYPELVDSVSERGFSPLHLLAGKPSAFKSGSHFGRFSKIIYLCTFVDELEVHDVRATTYEDEKDPKYPENYQTCINFYRLFRTVISVLLRVSKGKNNQKQGHTESQVSKNTQKQADTESQNIQKQEDTENQVLHKQEDSESQVSKGKQTNTDSQAWRRRMFPPNYHISFEAIKLMSKAMIIILGFGSREIRKIREKKEKHTWSLQIMNELLNHSSGEYENNGQEPQHLQREKEGETMPYIFHAEGSTDASEPIMTIPSISEPETRRPPSIKTDSETSRSDQKKKEGGKKNSSTSDSGEKEKPNPSKKKETPILIAAKNGVTEMVEKILELFPVAIHDMNTDKKNIVLLAVENRQPHVYQFLLKRKTMKDAVFHKVDNEGNSALHLAAMLGDYRPWLIPGSALQMQWEIKWYEFVKRSMPLHFFARYNKNGKTPKAIFTETHKDLVKSGGDWLTNTSESCSVVAALIATVAFATSSTVPGGVKQDIGTPTLENEPPFDVFAISSLVALCFSVTAVVMFLAILTSRYQERDFGTSLPRKLLVGLTSLFVSIASMLISFCAGHFFVLKDQLKFAAFPVYAVTCLPVTLFAVAQFPLYFDLIWATFKKIPQRSYNVVAQ